MNKDKIYITTEQLEEIEHYQRMFRHNSEKIEGLCVEELDDIISGFQLGKIYSHLEECFMGMMKLVEDIRARENR